MILKLYKRVLTLFVAACIVWGGSSAYALSISARGGFVMDADTGEEIYSQNGDTALVPASMTKVMAVYAIYDAMAQGRISKDTVITIGPALAEYSRNPGYSNVYLNAYEGYTLDELLSAIFVVSANAAVMAVGDYLYGSEANFAARMNQFVNDWGIDAHFYDCSGVSASNRVSPRAMATIAKRLVLDYPDCLNYSGKTYINFRGQTYYSTNKMLPGRAYDYSGTQGLKTGTTSAAGACFTSVVQRGGKRLISVVIGAPYSDARYTDSIAMLDYAFDKVGQEAPQQTVVKEEPNAAAARVYINDMPIPGFYDKNDSSVILVRVDDLSENGFDITYDDDSNTLTAVNNKSKQINGHFENTDTSDLVIKPGKHINIILRNDESDSGVYTAGAYDINGSAAINVKELVYLGWVVQRDTSATVVTR